ncbi:hypothetical protein ABFT80_21845 [Mesorhizobium sp. SB112]|uniref:hypothetical protein n=1 Tax=Mesorhizobium sp. SB112 TaxID=3151853 RepID=UPI003266F02A
MKLYFIPIALPLLTACVVTESTPTTGDRPQDEVPKQHRSPGGDRIYSFENGCLVILEARRAVVKSEAPACELYQRDIALLYASGD